MSIVVVASVPIIAIPSNMSQFQFQPSPSSRSSTSNEDLPIKATADDALQSKLATTLAGYYEDEFLSEFSAKGSRTFQPIIKRGTHARVCVMDRALQGFLTVTTSDCQVVVLGAGKDTTYFRLCSGALMGEQTQQQSTSIRWYEVDHTSVVQEKAMRIQESERLSVYTPNFTKTKHGFHSKGNKFSYHLIGHDLRESPMQLLEKLNLDTSTPTLFLMECVSMYMPLQANQELLQSIAKSTNQVYIAFYEPILSGINPSPNGRLDPFGQMMQRNLTKAKVATSDSCLLQTQTLNAQLDKLIRCGFSQSVGCDMWSAYQTVLTQEQRTTANRCEFLDEYEEWIMIMQHYSFVVGTAGKEEESRKDAFVGVAPSRTSDPSLLGFVAGQCQQLPK